MWAWPLTFSPQSQCILSDYHALYVWRWQLMPFSFHRVDIKTDRHTHKITNAIDDCVSGWMLAVNQWSASKHSMKLKVLILTTLSFLSTNGLFIAAQSLYPMTLVYYIHTRPWIINYTRSIQKILQDFTDLSHYRFITTKKNVELCQKKKNKNNTRHLQVINRCINHQE